MKQISDLLLNTLLLFAIAACFAAATMYLALRFNLRALPLDQPNERSLHKQPTPRIGGIAIALAATILLSWNPVPEVFQTLLVAALFLALVSAIDDRKSLPVGLRLAVQLVVAMFATYQLAMWQYSHAAGGDTSQLTWLFVPLGLCIAVLVIIWMTNLFNFMDGADGLAGGMAAIGFAAYAFGAMTVPTNDGIAMANVTLTLAGATAGFLLFNFPPARVFLGDVGSIPLGFLAAVLGMVGAISGMWPWWFGPMVFSVFLVDATVTLIKRLFRGEKIWLAHRDHYYQRLILSGWSHRKTTISYYFVMLSSAISALFGQKTQLHYTIISIWVITYASLVLYLERRLGKNKKDKPEEVE